MSTGVQAAQAGAGDELVAELHAGWLRRLLVPLAFGLFGALASAIATGAGERELALWLAVGPAVAAVLALVTYFLRRARITRSGVEVRGLFGTRRIAFADVEEFTFDARRYRLYLFVPIGRVAVVRLKGGGQTVRFHAGLARFDAYAPIVVDFAISAVVRRMREALDRGDRARFGRFIEADRGAVYVKGLLFGETRASLEELSIDVFDGEFELRTPERSLGRFAAKKVPNLLALPQLVEELSVTKGRPRPQALVEALRWGRGGKK